MSQNRSIIYVNLLIITDLNRTLNNLYPLLDYYGMKTKSPGSNPTLNFVLLLYNLYNYYYEIKIQCRSNAHFCARASCLENGRVLGFECYFLHIYI